MSDVITDADMQHLKDLARMNLSDEETQSIKQDLNKTLQYFQQLNELDTEGVEEMARPVDMYNVFREDVMKPTLTHEDAMSVAVESEEGYFKVPRTVDSGE